MINQIHDISECLVSFAAPVSVTAIVGWAVYTTVLTYHRTGSIIKALKSILP